MKFFNIMKLTSSVLLLIIALISCEQQTNSIPLPKGYPQDSLVLNDDFTLEELSFPQKKGVCMTMRDPSSGKGGGWDVNVPKLLKLKAGWLYTWGAGGAYLADGHHPQGIEFVPMMWGSGGDLTSGREFLQTQVLPQIINGNVKKFLGFNEPDMVKQSNMTVETAIKVWPILEELNIPLGSPGVAHPDGDDSWLAQFMAQADELGYRVDYICFHHYGGASSQAFIDKCKRLYAKYQRPLLITEFAVADWNASTIEDNKFSKSQVLKFMQESLTWMEETDYVLGYCWFSFAQADAVGTSSALFDTNGNLTELGKYYANFTPNDSIVDGGDGGDGGDSTVVTEGDNLVVNGDFETGDLSGWSTVSDVKAEKGKHINGTTSARLTGNSAKDRQLSQKITVEGGKTYTLSFTGRIHNGYGAEGEKVNDNGGELYASVKIGNEKASVLITLTEDTNTKKTANFSVPDGETEATIIFTKNKDIAFIDDVVVTLVKE